MALKIFAQFDDEHDLTRTHPPFDYLLVQARGSTRGHYRASKHIKKPFVIFAW